MEKDIDLTLWGWHVKDGALKPIMTKVKSSILLYFDENTSIISGTDPEGK